MAAPGLITLNVGGRTLTTLESTLANGSAYFAALLSQPWGVTRPGPDAAPLFVDADPALFEHLLNFLRRGVPPLFWSRSDGFNYPLYAALLQEAQYFGVDPLAQWIRDQKYLEAVTVHQSWEVVDSSNCYNGLRSYTDNVRKRFDGFEWATKGGLKRTRLQVWETRCAPPVRTGP